MLLRCPLSGRLLGTFSDDSRVADPRGLAVNRDEGVLFLNSGTNRVLALDPNGMVFRDTGPIEGLNPGGGNFGPDGRYYVGLRSARTIMAFSAGLDTPGEYVLPAGIVPFPRGFAFGRDRRLFLASGIGPNGEGDDTIVVFAANRAIQPFRLVTDPQLSPLDLAIAPNGNIVVSSEHPFGSSDAVTTIGNMMPSADTWSGSSLQPDRSNSANLAAYALLRTVASAAWPRMRLSLSISRAVNVWGPRCDCPD